MQTLVRNTVVKNDLNEILNSQIVDWNMFDGKTFYITGATGTIGSFLIRVLRHVRKHLQLNINIIASVRNKKVAKKMYGAQLKDKSFKLHINDINKPFKYRGKIDYIIHTACATDSKYFVEHPVEVFNTAVNGTENILNFANEKNIESMVFLSSMEVYGDISDENKILKEEDLGSIDITNPRSSYPMGKRAAETLCYNYAKEYSLPVKVARLAQVIGANADYNDTRVYAQFARSIVEKEDIILKTQGNKITGQCYITDVINAVFTILLNGKNGEVYNVANEQSAIRIKDIAQMLCEKYPNINLKFDISDTNIYPKETYWNLDTKKLQTLGWSAKVSLEKSYNKLVNSFYYQHFASKCCKYKKSFLEEIFSLSNRGMYKVITILGFEIEVDRKVFTKQYEFYPIDKNKIVFCNFKGAGYACNPKYIADEIIKRKLPYKLVWLTKYAKKGKDQFPNNIEVVDYNSKKAIKELSTARLWIDNQRKNFHIKRGLEKKEGQVYLQTWHGSLGIKKIGEESPITQINNSWLSVGYKDAEMLDYLISNSDFEDNVYKNNFWNNGEIKKFGHPRNDVFFFSNGIADEIKNKVFNSLNIKPNQKIALYVPTYREDRGLNYYNIDTDKIKEELKNKFGNDFTVLIRLHPNLVKESKHLFNYDDSVINATYYPDIQELLMCADVLISDYSSCMFDYMLSRRPVFIYATDIKEFEDCRGFYYPLESTPFPIASDNDELIKNIMNFDNEKYIHEVDKFLRDKGCIDDGHASERVVDLIEEIMPKC